MKRFDYLIIAGLVIGLGLTVWGISMGSALSAFINVPGILITLGGSFGAVLINFQPEQVKQVIRLLKQLLLEREEDINSLKNLFVSLVQKARREGMLSLEGELEKIDDAFIKNGLQMVIDGVEPEEIRSILETEIDNIERRHRLGQSFFRTWGSLAPAFGMIGTLIGLIQMLSSLDNPEAIGPGMAVALLTTFYGALLANLVFNPIAGKLAIRSEAEMTRKEAVIDSLLALQSGTNPRILQEKIKAFLPLMEREEREGEAPKGGGMALNEKEIPA